MTDEEVLDQISALVAHIPGRDPDPLPAGALIEEIEAWLDDDRQWSRGGQQHWRSLLGDLVHAIAFLESLATGADQIELKNLRERVKHLRRDFSRSGEPEAVVRRQLNRIVTSLRQRLAADSLIESAWRRAVAWARSEDRALESAIQAIHDLADIRGQDAKDTFSRLNRVLADSALEIAYLRGEPRPEDLHSQAGEDAAGRLELGVKVVVGPPAQATGVVWLEYLQAHLWHPYDLELGPRAKLYEADYLRSLLTSAPSDPRLPDDLVAKDDDGVIDSVWFGAHAEISPEIAQPTGVFLRLDLPEMPRTRLLSEARAIAEFLTGYASLFDSNEAGWVLSESHLVRGWVQSSSAASLNADLWRTEERRDITAYHLARRADVIGNHIPFPSNQLREAGNLLVWRRHAAASDSRAQIVFHDRVIEQVCGWAGLADPERFVTEWLRPMWVVTQIRHSVLVAYYNARDRLPEGARNLTRQIEVGVSRPAHASPNFRARINLKVLLEHLDELVHLSAGAPRVTRQLFDLQARLATKVSVDRWITEIEERFDRKAAVLRRTRNALVHGGPFTPRAVAYSSDIAMGLTNHALTPAVDFMLDGRDTMDAFLDQRDSAVKAATELRAGTPATGALFSEDASS
jgi:hypothetical protein